MSTLILFLSAFVSILVFQSYIHPSQSLSCYKCFYDEGNPETYDCLNNLTAVANCTSRGGLEACETISAVSSTNFSRKIILRQCTENIFGFYCEQGYPMTYEFLLDETEAENDAENSIVRSLKSTTSVQSYNSYNSYKFYKFNLTQVRICFCRSQDCNDDVHDPWSMPTTPLQQLQEPNPVCHVCVVLYNVPVPCPTVSCKIYGKNFTKCLTISGYSSAEYDYAPVDILKCGSGEENPDGCVDKPMKKHYDAEGWDYILENTTICSCTGSKCNAPPFYQNQSSTHQFNMVILVALVGFTSLTVAFFYLTTT